MILAKQDEDMEAHVVSLRSECADTASLSVYLVGVRNLIDSASKCPGVREVKLKIPDNHCRTDGTGECTWECSSEGQTFASGGWYGHLETLEPVITGDEGHLGLLPE